MLRHSAAALVVVSAFSAWFVPAFAQSHHAGELTLEPYAFRTYDGASHPAELGHLWVRENRSGSQTRLIELAFVRLKSRAPQPGSPVVFLAGGPGIPGIGMARVPVYYELFRQLQAREDVILLDQRGTGLSSPNPQCPQESALPADVLATEAAFREALFARARSCVRSWRAQGVDVAAYSTAASAEDLEVLRQALGAEKLSLLGHSYGTSLALEAMRRHGDRLDRVVLAAVQGPDNAVPMPLVFDFALRRLSDLAAADPHLHGAFPDTYGEFRQVVEAASRQPLTVRIHSEQDKKDIRLHVGAFALQFAVRDMLPNGRKAGRIPALVNTLAHGDTSLAAPAIQDLYNALRSGFSAMQFGVLCSDGWSSSRRRQAEEQARVSVFGDAPLVQIDAELCRTAGLERGRDSDPLPFWSYVETLFVSGSLDSNTPPFDADALRWRFARGSSLRIVHGFHETLPAPEVQTVVANFLGGGEAGGQTNQDQTIRFAEPAFLTLEEAKASTPAEH